MQPVRARQGGFTYLALLFFVAIAGIMVSAEGVLWSIEKQREKEQALLFVGNEIRQAICLYYEHSPGTVKRYPKSLQDLLLDNRQLSITRYLRRVYVNPMTGKADWILVRAPDGGVKGVAGRFEQHPMRQPMPRQRSMPTSLTVASAEWTFQYEPGPANALTPPCMHINEE